MKPRILPLAAASLLLGCGKDEPAQVDLGHDYFPTNIGHWVEYQVDSLRVRLGSLGNDTTWYSYQLREQLVEDFTDNEGRPAQRIIRYTKDANGNWLPKDVWWQTRDNVRAERSEENMRRVKLIFPPRIGTEWNTNATNTDRAFGLKYTAIDEPGSINGHAFDKVLTVKGTTPANLITTKNYTERYARGIGMIEHEVDSIVNQFLQGNYDRWYVRYSLTGHGN